MRLNNSHIENLLERVDWATIQVRPRYGEQMDVVSASCRRKTINHRYKWVITIGSGIMKEWRVRIGDFVKISSHVNKPTVLRLEKAESPIGTFKITANGGVQHGHLTLSPPVSEIGIFPFSNRKCNFEIIGDRMVLDVGA